MPLVIKQASKGKDGKTYWRNIGRAFKTKAGNLNLILDVLPLPQFDEQYGMQVSLSVFEEEPRHDRREHADRVRQEYDRGMDAQRSRSTYDDPRDPSTEVSYQEELDDKIPF